MTLEQKEELEQLEQFVAQYPVFEYRIISTEEVSFEPRVRIICKQECERYDTTWACPPGVGSLEECETRCRAYQKGFFFSTVAEVCDIMNMEELLSTRKAHEEITDHIRDFMEKQGRTCYVLSTESCAICDTCTYPDGPCRFPKKMHPCLESHGVIVSELVESHEMTYQLGGNTVLWFSMILFS